MKTFTFLSFSHSLSRASRIYLQAVLFCCSLCFGAVPSFAQISVTGQRSVCPQIDSGTNNYTYTVNNIPNNSSIGAEFVGPFLNGSHGTIIKVNANTFEVEYASRVATFYPTLLFRAFNTSQQETSRDTLHIIVSVNSPAPINGGNILVCPNGPDVELTTTNGNDLGCGFHCTYIYNAPPGVTLEGGIETGNQISENSTHKPMLLSSGLPNGNLGSLKVTALWENCGLDGDNFGYATVFSGPPLLNPRVNGVPPQGNNCVNGSALLTAEYQTHTNYMNWTKIGGNGTISPNGASCSANPNGFMAVKVEAGNGCGTSSYTYYLSDCGNAAYTISPNPATSSLTVDFEYKEFAEG